MPGSNSAGADDRSRHPRTPVTAATPQRRPGRPPNPAGPGVEVRARLSPRALAALDAWALARGLGLAGRRKQLEALIAEAAKDPRP